MQVQRPASDYRRYFSNDNKQSSDQLEKEKEDKEAQDKLDEEIEEETKSFDEELAELSFFQRYKKLVKEYWYVLFPVHGVLSILWFGGLILLQKR